MQVADQPPVQKSPEQMKTIAIAATFTAEPIEEPLAFWMQELDLPFTVEFAPYNQVFQQLLDPSSLLAANQSGINILLLRLEDWQRFSHSQAASNSTVEVERNVADLIGTLKTAIVRSSTPWIVCLCPSSPAVTTDPERSGFFQQMEDLLRAELRGINGLYLLGTQELLDAYPVANYYDPQRDSLGHIPFTPVFFTALGTVIARKIYTLKTAPHKVIVLDCDNTIWKGVVGEDGVMGIEVPPAWKALQEFMVTQQQAGMVICLCSKNNEPDVMEVFEQRSDMPLKLEHLVAWRINWLPKSENIKSLAAELNLGLDSFIFIDDNPVECAEVQLQCPDVLTLRLPIDGDIPQFLNHVWAFDHLKVTEEDKQRTALYKQNVERNRFQQEAQTIDDFLAGLELKIQITEPTPEQLPRVAQLTQRTNQFNFTTVRRSESDIQQLAQSGLECRVVEVSDRFGDYGLVGVMIFSTNSEALTIDTVLLSCRVLGRGVEHRMLNHLGEIAQERQLAVVNAPYIPSKKNLPALNFLEKTGAAHKQVADDGYRFAFPADVAAALSYTADAAQLEAASETQVKPASASASPAAASISKSARLSRIALELYQPEAINQAIAAQQTASQRQLDQPIVPPRNPIEAQLVEIWQQLLNVDAVGIEDNYFDLGGTSLLAVELIAQIETVFGKKLPLTSIVELPTIAQLGQRLSSTEATGDRAALVLLRDGGSQKPPIFLVHDGDGETLLYLNLARRLSPEHRIYGIQPYSRDNHPILHTRIAEMAAYYLEQIRAVQTTGPYLLGGMCAGGVLSFEMAKQLQAQGQTVALVALMDAADVEAQHRSVASQRLDRFSAALSQTQQTKAYQRAFSILNKVRQKVVNLVAYETQKQVKKVQASTKVKLFRYFLDRKLPLPSWLQNLPVRMIYVFAEKQYVPEGRYDGEVVLLRAIQGDGTIEDEAYIERYTDPLLGWGNRATRVQVYDIPGGHSSMLQEPHVEVMADKLQAYIDQGLAERSPTRPEVNPTQNT